MGSSGGIIANSMKLVESLYTLILIFCFLSFCETQRTTTLKLEIGRKYSIRCTTSIWISEPMNVLEIYFNQVLHFKATKAIGIQDFNLIETTVQNKVYGSKATDRKNCNKT